MFCPSCGHNVQEGTLFCPQCGTSLKTAAPSQSSNPAGSCDTLCSAALALSIIALAMSLFFSSGMLSLCCLIAALVLTYLCHKKCAEAGITHRYLMPAKALSIAAACVSVFNWITAFVVSVISLIFVFIYFIFICLFAYLPYFQYSFYAF